MAVGNIAKSLLFLGKDGRYRLLVCQGDRKVSNAKLKAAFGVKSRMATAEETLAATGFKPGGVCPFGVEGLEILLDGSLAGYGTLYPADVAVDFPKLDLIVAHAGRPLWGETSFFLARRHPRVWLDLWGIPPKRLLRFLPRLVEVADRCLWGSDWPGPGVRDLKKNVEDFRALGLPGPATRAILDANARRLLP